MQDGDSVAVQHETYTALALIDIFLFINCFQILVWTKINLYFM